MQNTQNTQNNIFSLLRTPSIEVSSNGSKEEQQPSFHSGLLSQSNSLMNRLRSSCGGGLSDGEFHEVKKKNRKELPPIELTPQQQEVLEILTEPKNQRKSSCMMGAFSKGREVEIPEGAILHKQKIRLSFSDKALDHIVNRHADELIKLIGNEINYSKKKKKAFLRERIVSIIQNILVSDNAQAKLSNHYKLPDGSIKNDAPSLLVKANIQLNPKNKAVHEMVAVFSVKKQPDVRIMDRKMLDLEVVSLYPNSMSRTSSCHPEYFSRRSSLSSPCHSGHLSRLASLNLSSCEQTPAQTPRLFSRDQSLSNQIP